MDRKTTEILFGGGAGGAKSFLGCAWLIYMCGAYKGTRWMMGRSKLKNLKQTTLNTFFDVCRRWKVLPGVHYKYNSFDGTIKFSNGSEIILKDLFLYPADPNFDSLGSLELTGAFIDEANQVCVKAKNIVTSRMRYKHTEHGLVAKLFLTCNPAKNYVYSDFYKPWKDGKMPSYRKFVQALAKDNPYLPPAYIEQLKRLDKNSRERLLNGNWEYDDDPTKMFDFEAITDLFTNKVLMPHRRYERYLSVDVVRHGTDKTVIGRWEGLQLREIQEMSYCGTNDIVDKVNQIAQVHGIGRSQIVVDEDGVGGGVVDNLAGCVGFLNNGKVLKDSDTQLRNFTNLKTQCYFMLADKVRNREVGIECTPEQRDTIIEDLEQIKEKTIDTENKVAVISKDEIRETLGRSPDYADMLMMRMWWELFNPGSLAEVSNRVYDGDGLDAKNSIGGNLFTETF